MGTGSRGQLEAGSSDSCVLGPCLMELCPALPPWESWGQEKELSSSSNPLGSAVNPRRERGLETVGFRDGHSVGCRRRGRGSLPPPTLYPPLLPSPPAGSPGQRELAAGMGLSPPLVALSFVGPPGGVCGLGPSVSHLGDALPRTWVVWGSPVQGPAKSPRSWSGRLSVGEYPLPGASAIRAGTGAVPREGLWGGCEGP